VQIDSAMETFSVFTSEALWSISFNHNVVFKRGRGALYFEVPDVLVMGDGEFWNDKGLPAFLPLSELRHRSLPADYRRAIETYDEFTRAPMLFAVFSAERSCLNLYLRWVMKRPQDMVGVHAALRRQVYRCPPCGKETPGLKQCSECGLRFYCSERCRDKHWATAHRDECCDYRTGLERARLRAARTAPQEDELAYVQMFMSRMTTGVSVDETTRAESVAEKARQVDPEASPHTNIVFEDDGDTETFQVDDE
jgi:hypothetical protein